MKNHYRPVSQWLAAPPDTPVLSRAGHITTATGLAQQVKSLYARLRQHPAECCVLCFRDCGHFIAALLAVLHAGKRPVLPGSHDPSLCLPLPEGENSLLLTDGSLPPDSEGWFTPHEQNIPASEISLPDIPADSILTLYTSGSGGTPKRVDKTVSVMDCEVRWLAECRRDKPDAVYVRSSVSHQHLYGLTFRVWLPLSLGLVTDIIPAEFPEQLPFPEPYIFITSPAFLQFIDHTLAPPHWSLIISAGGKLSDQLADATQRWGNTVIYEIYGSTETGVVARRERHESDNNWRPFAGVTLTAAEEPSRYYLTSALLASSVPFLLDDKLSIAPDGRFTLTGRADNILKIGEKRISVTAVENLLTGHPAISEAAVVPVNRGGRTYLGAVIVTGQTMSDQKISQSALFTQLRAFLRGNTDPLAIPRFWRVVPSIPLNPQSKRSWAVLQELFNVAD
ncbi:AMP-binding protein [Morganella morganii]|uniref:AMP-binding protein n=1 Tax=Morganella morganii TaxID=582 RepID=UPI00076B4579|nr:AMP-binding protein [Morganella morganii]AMG71972.1 hypothetical protein AL531_17350 [Morganella morganii]EJK8625151.1 AMP-binding protein [Morganella morganii]EKU4289056.1 AMP-binding protein [Morganella morganii]EKU4304593.1 AMP-binding protein [Morganella morganii]EKU5664815.1 AMP-binding protein [Morganella morganii]